MFTLTEEQKIERAERLEKVAFAIEAMSCATPVEGIHQFNITSWIGRAFDEEGEVCGTACCIAGTAIMLFAGDEATRLREFFDTNRVANAYYDYGSKGCELLHLNTVEGSIFYAFEDLHRPAAAAWMLRHLKDHYYNDYDTDFREALHQAAEVVTHN